MLLLDPENIQIEPSLLNRIDAKSKSIFRAITFCKRTSSRKLLDNFINSTNSLTELLSIKNAQMEAETKEDIIRYHKNLNKAISFVINEIKSERSLTSQVQLFQIFRLISPDAHRIHPNRYRNTLVQIGTFLCPNPKNLNDLVLQLFYNMERISHPLLQAIYFHHELIRIHPFVDGNGRTTRIAKNWILMYNLYPPIFIKDKTEKKSYINALKASFNAIAKDNLKWHDETKQFFQQELNRVSQSIQYILTQLKGKAISEG